MWVPSLTLSTSLMDEPGFQVLFEDAAALAVSKPTGVATQAPVEFDSLEARIRRYLADSGASEPIYLGLPHRLDRAVSGAMVFAKTRRAARQLSRQFERRQVKKTYWACVSGIVLPDVGAWTDFLWKVYGQPRAQVVEAVHQGGQKAVLSYRSIGTHRYGSWLEIELETGRTHQVRVQASSRGFPIVGDAHYGSEIAFGPAGDDERLKPIALHARSLRFMHPDSRVEIALVAALPTEWDALDLKESSPGK